MSAYYCKSAITTAVYPPVQESSLDLAREEQLASLQAEAPFGRASTGTPITSGQYITAMNRDIKDAKKLDFRWPFWAGLGLGVAGVAWLALKSR